MKPETADLSTDAIVTEVRKGDVEAFRQIVLRYQGEVMKIVNAMLIDYSSREDVVQQVFVRAFQRIDQYEIGRGFSHWVKAIARNMVREELRKRYRYQGRIEAYAHLVVSRLEGDQAGEDSSAERADALQECIGQLESSAAQAVRLHYVERRRTDQIAEDFGRSGGSVRTLLYRARTQLRKCLEMKGMLA